MKLAGNRVSLFASFPSLPDPPHPVSATLVLWTAFASHRSIFALSDKQAPTSPAAPKNYTPLQSVSTALWRSAFPPLDVHFLGFYRS